MHRWRARCPNCRHPFTARETALWGSEMLCPTCRCRLRESSTQQKFFALGMGLPIAGVVIGMRIVQEWWALAVGLPIIAVIALAAYFLAPWFMRFEIVSAHPHCGACWYDLHGSESESCPECGTLKSAPVKPGGKPRTAIEGSKI